MLNTINQAKSEWRASPVLSVDEKRKLLPRGMPRFIWRARAWLNASLAFEIILDATGVPRGTQPHTLVVYGGQVTLAAQKWTQQCLAIDNRGDAVCQWFVQQDLAL